MLGGPADCHHPLIVSGKVRVLFLSLKKDQKRLGCRARSESSELKQISRLSCIRILAFVRSSRYFCR